MVQVRSLAALLALSIVACSDNDQDDKTDSSEFPDQVDSGDEIDNRAPEAEDVELATPEDTPLTVQLPGTDPDGDELRFTVQTEPEHGALSIDEGQGTYTPEDDFFGTDAFVVRVSDGLLFVDVTVTIEVQGVEDEPVANDTTLTTDEDTPLDVSLSASDADGDRLTFTITTPPTLGTLSGTVPDVTYTPDPNTNGSDHIVFEATDGKATATGTVDITIAPVEDVPEARDVAVSTDEDVAVAFTLDAFDGDGDALTYQVDAPSGGSLQGSAPDLTFTPPADASGTFTVAYRVSDGQATSPDGTVTITVAPVADAPVATGGALLADEDTPVVLTPVCTDADGDPTTVTWTSQPPEGGELVDNAGSWTWTPPADLNGTFAFTFTCSDGVLTSAPATLTVTLDPVPDAPVAESFLVQTNEDVPAPVLLRATDADGDSLSFTVQTDPSHGTLTGTPPNLIYTPDPEFDGTDQFTYTASDGTLTSAVATVDLTILFAPDAPVATPGSVEVDEDATVALTLTGTDPDEDPLTFEVVQQPGFGTLTGTPPDLTYTPDPDANGADQFTFRAFDGTSYSGPALFEIAVRPVNDAPVASQATVTTDEDTEVCADLPVSDVDGDTLTVAFAASANGVVTVDGTAFCATPPADVNGTLRFDYTVSDPSGEAASAALVLNVLPIQDPPTAGPSEQSTLEDTPVVFDLPVADVDGDTLTCAVGALSLGQAGVVGCTVTYTPDPDANGTESTTYTVDDGQGGAPVEGSLQITVEAVDDVPVLADGSAVLAEDSVSVLTLAPFDADGDALTLSVVGDPSHGQATLEGTELTYTPDADFHGVDAVVVEVTDGTTAVTATFSYEVTPVNDPPVAATVLLSGNEDETLVGVLDVSDVDGPSLTYTVTSNPSHAQVTPGPFPAFEVVPDADFHGTDGFTVEVSDGEFTVDAVVSYELTPQPDRPVLGPFAVAVDEDDSAVFSVPATDADGDTLTASFGGAQSAWFTGSGLAFTVTPAANAHGTFIVPVTVQDPSGRTAVADLTLTVAPVNDAPTLADRTVTTPEDTVWNGTLVGIDIDGDSLTYSLRTPPARGTATVSPGGGVTYTPVADDTGPVDFVVAVADPSAAEDTATITVLIGSENDAPVATCAPTTLNEDGVGTVTVVGTDSDGDALTFTVVSPPELGTALPAALQPAPDTQRVYDYVPTPDVNGSDSLQVQVSDGELSDTVLCAVTIDPVEDPPVGAPLVFDVPEDGSYDGTAVATDADGDTLTWSVLSGPNHGGLDARNLPSFLYTPDPDYNGPDTFRLQVTDGTTPVEIQAVVTVTAVPDAPQISCSALTVPEDLDGTLSFLATDADGTTPLVAVEIDPAHGVLTPNGAGSWVYAPDADYFGSDTVELVADDGALQTYASCSITVLPINDAPVAVDAALTLDEDTSRSVSLDASDVDNGAGELVFSIASQPASGSVTLAGRNATYTPSPNFHGTDVFTFRVTDGTGPGALQDIGTVTVTVDPINDPPQLSCPPLAMDEDDPATELPLALSDIDGDTLTVSGATLTGVPGTTEIQGQRVLFTPDPDANGAGQVAVTVTDGTASPSINCPITVAPVNDPPVFAALADTSPEDVTYVRPLAGQVTDVDGDPLEFSLGLPDPALGEAVVTLGGQLTYTPDPDVNGSDTVFVIVDDGTTTAVGRIDLEITPVDDLPTISCLPVTVAEDGSETVGYAANDIDSSPLSVVVSAAPSHGAVTGSGPFTYAPDPDYFGTDSFELTVTAGGESASATCPVTVSEINDAPVASDVAASTDEDTSVVITLPGTDVDGPSLSWSVPVGQGPSHGSVSIAGDQATYTPAGDFYGTDTFRYRVTDGLLQDTAEVTVTVAPVNDRPVVSCEGLTTVSEDASATSLPLVVTDADPTDAPTVTGTVVSGVAGTAQATGLTVRFTPDPDANGRGLVSIDIDDGSGAPNSSASTSCEVDVTPVNDAPVTSDVAVSTDEDNAVVLTLPGSDVDGPSLTWTLQPSAPPSLGGASLNGDQVTYTPDPDVSGTDSFGFEVSDGVGGVASGTVTVTIDPINDAPVGADDSLTLPEDGADIVFFVGTDVDNPFEDLSFEIVSPPSRGTLNPVLAEVEGPQGDTDVFDPGGWILEYVADPDDNGTDVFTYRVFDGQAYSSTHTITVTITPQPDAPSVISPSSVGPITEDGAVGFNISVVDPDGPDVFTAAGTASHGVVTIDNSTPSASPYVIYQPDPDYNGPDTIQVRATDSTGRQGPAWDIAITVTPTPDDPVITGPTFSSVQEDSSNAWDVLITDPDGPDTFTVVGTATHGTIAVLRDDDALPRVQYTPDADYNGPDTLLLQATDSSGRTSPSFSFGITVQPINDNPVVTGRLSTDEDTPFSFDPLTVIDDVDDTLTVLSVALVNGSEGFVTPITTPVGFYSFTPAPNLHGEVLLSVQVREESNGTTPTLTVPIDVAPVNDLPTLSGRLSLSEDGSVTFDPLTYLSDVDADPISVLDVTTTTGQGTVAPDLFDPALWEYTPDADAHGTFFVDLLVWDGVGDPGTDSITLQLPVDVAPVNDPPLLTQTSLSDTTNDITPVVFPVGVTDVDNSQAELSLQLVAPPAAGAASIDGLEVTYTPSKGSTGPFAFQVRASDGAAPSASTLTISVYVNPSNRPPEAQSDVYGTAGNYLLSVSATHGVLANDTEPDGQSMSVVPFSGTLAQGGQLDLAADGSFVYQPAIGVGGVTESYTYTVSDGQGGSDTATVTFDLGEVVWFVDQNAGPGGDGTSDKPFHDTLSAQSVAKNTDIIHLEQATKAYRCFTVPEGVTLHGSRLELVVKQRTVAPATAARPIIESTGGDCLEMSTDSEVRHVQVVSVEGAAVYGSDLSGPGLKDVVVTAGTNGLRLSTGSDARVEELTVLTAGTTAVQFSSWINAQVGGLDVQQATGAGLSVSGASYGSWLIYDGTIDNVGGHGISVYNTKASSDLRVEVQKMDVFAGRSNSAAGVLLGLSGTSGKPGSLTVRDSTITGFGQYGLYVTLTNVGALTPFAVTTENNFAAETFTAFAVETAGTARARWDALADTAGGPEQSIDKGFDVVASGSSQLVASLVEVETVDAYLRGLGIESSGTAVVVAEAAKSRLVGLEGQAVRVVAAEQSRLDVTLGDNVSEYGGWVFDGSGFEGAGVLQTHLYANDIGGVYAAIGSRNGGFVGWGNTAYSPSFTIAKVTDLIAALDSRGNTSAGGTPSASLVETLTSIDPGGVLRP